jgi:hypothetical protein|tara:strand:- start:548 stop:694 length:147 start_codon:yes stop_codon:yes gene_type:complete
MKTEEILRKNVRDLQEQLQVCYIKNKELTDTVRRQGKVIDMLLGRDKK